ncbi:MAG: hypothetical protein KAJ88_00970 [Candidatus Aenigmarchaeota archaeon]|nr:hypothetical protein [Candidatus Aenigmarchaeota archaeon]
MVAKAENKNKKTAAKKAVTTKLVKSHTARAKQAKDSVKKETKNEKSMDKASRPRKTGLPDAAQITYMIIIILFLAFVILKYHEII